MPNDDGTMTYQEALEEHKRRRKNVGTLSTRRQREAAIRRRREREAAGEKSFTVEWDTTDYWVTESSVYMISDAEYAMYTLSDEVREDYVMSDGFLWQTVIWVIRNAVPLCEQVMDIPADQPAGLVAYTWLRCRPLFRALVKESIRRDLTFPADVFRYLKDYVLDEQQTLDGYKPWKDPRTSGQAEELKDFLDRPLVPPEVEFGRDLRQIDLDG